MINEECSFRNRSIFFVQITRTMFRSLCKLLFCLTIWLIAVCWLNVLTLLMRTSCASTTYVRRIVVVDDVMSCKNSLSCFILSFVFSKRASSFKSSLSRRLIDNMFFFFSRSFSTFASDFWWSWFEWLFFSLHYWFLSSSSSFFWFLWEFSVESSKRLNLVVLSSLHRNLSDFRSWSRLRRFQYSSSFCKYCFQCVRIFCWCWSVSVACFSLL